MRCMPANLSENAAELNGLLEMERKETRGGGGRKLRIDVCSGCLELWWAGLVGDLCELFMAYIEQAKFI